MTPDAYKNVNIYGKNINIKAQAVPTGNSRETDARALLSCASGLDAAKKLLAGDMKSKENLKIYGDAIRRNQQLWTIFQVALSDAGNPLPDGLKAILLNLSRYVDKTSFQAVGNYTPELVDSLININRRIAAGLSTQVATAADMPPIDTRDIPTGLMTSA